MVRTCYSISTATVPASRNLALHSQCSGFSSEIWLIQISQPVGFFDREVQQEDFAFPKQQHRKKNTEEEREIKATLICKQRLLLKRLAGFYPNWMAFWHLAGVPINAAQHPVLKSCNVTNLICPPKCETNVFTQLPSKISLLFQKHLLWARVILVMSDDSSTTVPKSDCSLVVASSVRTD